MVGTTKFLKFLNSLIFEIPFLQICPRYFSFDNLLQRLNFAIKFSRKDGRYYLRTRRLYIINTNFTFVVYLEGDETEISWKFQRRNNKILELQIFSAVLENRLESLVKIPSQHSDSPSVLSIFSQPKLFYLRLSPPPLLVWMDLVSMRRPYGKYFPLKLYLSAVLRSGKQKSSELMSWNKYLPITPNFFRSS